MAEEFYIHQLGNGLTLVAQRMPQMSSAALTLAVPSGSSRDPDALAGAAVVCSHWLFRGAGDRDSRQLHDALDGLGSQHDEHPQSAHLLLSAAQLGRNLPAALAIYADVIRRPRLEADSFEPCRELVTQALQGLEDEPTRKCNMLIRERFYPHPLGRNPYGTTESLAQMTAEGLRRHVKATLTPQGAILAVAGAFEWNELRDQVEKLLGDWAGAAPPAIAVLPARLGVEQVAKETAQVQITFAYRAATMNNEQYYPARLCEMVLSGGMSARLFTEVREKRGLVYNVSARYHSLKDYAGMFVYAGTAPERAQETFDVTLRELRRVGEDVCQAELDRARVQLKSALIMQGESTSARADALAGDYFHLGRLRALTELSQAIDAVTVEQVKRYMHSFPAENLTVLTIGPKQLETHQV